MRLGRPGARALIWAALTALYTAAALASLRPIWRIGGDHLSNSLSDPLFNLWVLKWGVHQIHLGLPDVWNANIFYPLRGTLALSDHLLGPAAQLAAFLAVVPNAIAGYNFLLFSSFVASALAACWVARRSGLSWGAAVLAGWMFAFAPFRFSQVAHIQLLLAQWIPLTLWFWDRLLAERTAKNAALFLVFYLLHVTGGCYLAYMIHFPLLAILASRALSEGRALLSPRSLRLLAPVVLAAAGALLVLFLPYVRISRAQGLTRTEGDIRQFGATLASYFSPAGQNVYFGHGTKNWLRSIFGPDRARLFFRSENALFAGFLPTLLFGIGAVASWRRRGDPWARGLALSGLLCLALSFPVVYEPLMRVVPGLAGMRVIARFYVFVSFCLTWFAGRGADALLGRLSHPAARAALAAALALVLAAELTPRPLLWVPLPREERISEAYHWIAREPSVTSLVELPVHRGTQENVYLYSSTVHWKPLANGFSGYDPPIHQELVERIRFVPGEDGLGLLRRIGISHLVVHADSPRRAEALRRWEERFAAGPAPQVELVHRSGEISVYRLLYAPANSRTPNRAGL
jgi:hypothetical protein